MLPQPPTGVELRFSEPVQPLLARLTDPHGNTQVLGEETRRGTAISFPLPKDLQQGTHILSWRVVSSDGHPIGGGLLFSVGASSAAAPPAASDWDLSVAIGLWAARFLLIGALVFGVGGAAFALIAGVPAPGRRRVLPAALSVGVLAAAALVPLQGLDALGEPLASAVRPDAWSAGLWATSYGRATLLAATALLVAFASVEVGRRRAGVPLAAAALVLAGLAFAVAGHAASAPPRWLMAPAVFVHVVSVLVWLGALLPLGAGLARGGPDAVLALDRFSAVIPAAVLALLASGVVIAIVQVGRLAALWSTDYGLVLVAKLVLVAAMLSLAAANRFLLTRPAVAGDNRASTRLRRSIGAEVVLGFAVIGVLGLWRFTPPSRAMAADPARFEVQSVRATEGEMTARLSIQPPIAGPTHVEVSDIRLHGEAIVPKEVRVELGKPTYGIGPFTKDARRVGETWRADGYLLPIDGFWVVRVTILVSDFKSVTLMDAFEVRKGTDPAPLAHPR